MPKMLVLDGSKVRAAREAKGWNLADLAAHARILTEQRFSVQDLSRLEQPLVAGRQPRDVRTSTLQNLCTTLGVAQADLMTEWTW